MNRIYDTCGGLTMNNRHMGDVGVFMKKLLHNSNIRHFVFSKPETGLVDTMYRCHPGYPLPVNAVNNHQQVTIIRYY